MNSKKKIREFVLLEKSTPRKKKRNTKNVLDTSAEFTSLMK